MPGILKRILWPISLIGGNATGEQSRPAGNPFALKMNDAETDVEKAKNDYMLTILEDLIKKSNYFIEDKIPVLLNIIRQHTVPFGRIDFSAPQKGTVLLSNDQKAALGLNKRVKYYKEFIDLFEPETLDRIDPKRLLSNMQLDAFHRATRHFDLLKYKKLGFVTGVRIVPVEACSAVARLNETYVLSKVPELPLAECDRICMCMYQPIFETS